MDAPKAELEVMEGFRSMIAKTRFTAPEALVTSGKAIWAPATPLAAKVMQKNTCNTNVRCEAQELHGSRLVRYLCSLMT